MKVSNIAELNSSLVIFELMGLQYFSLKLLSNENLNDRPSIIRVVYMLALLILVSFFMVTFIASDVHMINGHITAKNVLTFAMQNCMNVGLILVVCTSLIQSLMSTQRAKKIYLNTNDIVQLYRQEFKLDIDFKRINRASTKKLLLMVAIFFTAHGTVTFIKVNSFEDKLTMLLSVVPIFFLLMVVFKFVFYVGIVNGQLKLLNEMLENIWMYHPIMTFDNIDFHVLTNVKSRDDPLMKLRVLRRIYNITFEIGTLINNSNGLTILVMLINLVIALTAKGYQAFVIGVGGLPTDRVPGEFSILLLPNFHNLNLNPCRNDLHHDCFVIDFDRRCEMLPANLSPCKSLKFH